MSRGCALVTGGAKRIGRAVVLELAAAGYDLAIHHRAAPADAGQASEAVRASGQRAAVLSAELTEPGTPERLIAQAADALGPVTLLVNCASVFEDDRLGGLTSESWDRHLRTNLQAPVFLTQAFAAALPPEREGLVVNILDQRVNRLNPQFFSYTLSKSALWTATQTMAQALAPRIRVNGVAPGPTLPSIHQQNGEFEREAAAVPLQRRATPEEVAKAVRFLADSPSVTGQMIAVDGGQHLAWRTPDIVSD